MVVLSFDRRRQRVLDDILSGLFRWTQWCIEQGWDDEAYGYAVLAARFARGLYRRSPL